MLKVRTPKCTVCHETSIVEVDSERYTRWISGEFIQDVFPDMTPDQREMLITGTHKECWDKIFDWMDEDDELDWTDKT